MSNGNKLVVLTDVEKRLATVATIDEAKDIRDKAEAIRVYARSVHASLNIVNRAATIKLLAERRGGELLAQVPTLPGRNPTHKSARPDSEQAPQPTKREVISAGGLAPSTAHKWETLAKGVTEAVIRKLEAEANDASVALTTEAVYRAAKTGEAVIRAREVRAQTSREVTDMTLRARMRDGVNAALDAGLELAAPTEQDLRCIRQLQVASGHLRKAMTP